MDAQLIKMFGQIAGIGGLTLGVMLLVFRQMLGKNIFPKLRTPQAYSLLRLILLLVWSTAVFGIAAWVSTTWINSRTIAKKDHVGGNAVESEMKTVQTALILIDDVVVGKAKNHVVLDVRLRNAGQAVANITRLNLHVLNRVPYAATYSPSASYDLLLSDIDNTISVSHALRPEEVDNLLVKVGFTKYNTSCGFETRLELYYNKDQKAIFENVSFSSTFH